MQVRVLSTLQYGDEALVDEHVLCKHEVVDSSSTYSTNGRLAQLEEHLPYMQGVTSSILVSSTISRYSTTVSAPVFQTGDVSSILTPRSLKLEAVESVTSSKGKFDLNTHFLKIL